MAIQGSNGESDRGWSTETTYRLVKHGLSASLGEQSFPVDAHPFKTVVYPWITVATQGYTANLTGV